MLPLLAEIDAVGWVMIIGAFFAGLSTFTLQVIGLIQGNIREKARQERAEVISEKVEKQDAKTDALLEHVHEVKEATNGMKQELIKVTESEALARGAADERRRADAASVQSQLNT